MLMQGNDDNDHDDHDYNDCDDDGKDVTKWASPARPRGDAAH